MSIWINVENSVACFLNKRIHFSVAKSYHFLGAVWCASFIESLAVLSCRVPNLLTPLSASAISQPTFCSIAILIHNTPIGLLQIRIIRQFFGCPCILVYLRVNMILLRIKHIITNKLWHIQPQEMDHIKRDNVDYSLGITDIGQCAVEGAHSVGQLNSGFQGIWQCCIPIYLYCKYIIYLVGIKMFLSIDNCPVHMA